VIFDKINGSILVKRDIWKNIGIILEIEFRRNWVVSG
jgi:hypothetical protein